MNGGHLGLANHQQRSLATFHICFLPRLKSSETVYSSFYSLTRQVMRRPSISRKLESVRHIASLARVVISIAPATTTCYSSTQRCPATALDQVHISVFRVGIPVSLGTLLSLQSFILLQQQTRQLKRTSLFRQQRKT